MGFVASSTRSSRLAEYGWLVASARTGRHRPVRADHPAVVLRQSESRGDGGAGGWSG
jgi:hypothetical protein